MFICSVCDKPSKPGDKQARVVIETRSKVYPARPGSKDPGGVGHEIIKEVTMCLPCESNLQ